MKKYLINIFVLLVIIAITIKNETLVFQNSSIELSTKTFINSIKVSLPLNNDDGRIELVANNKTCTKYIKDDILSFKELTIKDKNLSHTFNIFSTKNNMDNCTFRMIIFKRHPNPFIALFFVHLPIIIILYLLIKVFLIWYKNRV